MALVGKDAQVEFDNKYGATKTTETKLEFNGTGLVDTEKWDGDLVIDGYTAATEINFSKNLMDGLIIKNCPKLKKININDNEFLRVDLSELGASNVLEDLFANGNQLTDLNVKNCKEIKKLKLRNNAGLNKAKGLEELENIDEIDLTGNPKFRLIHTNKLNGYVEAKEVIKEMLGLNADDSLPDSVRVASGGKLDPDKLKSEITNKINSQVPQLTTDKENAEKERDAANAKLDAQKDYDTIKTERDQLQQQLEAIKTELGLKNDATQQQIIDKIKELKGRPANTDYDAIKSQRDSLQTQVNNLQSENDRLKNENKENRNTISKGVLVEGAKNWGITLSSEQSQKIQTASAATEVETTRNEIIKSEFGRLKDENASSDRLNICLGVVAISSLLILGWVLLSRSSLPEPKKEK